MAQKSDLDGSRIAEILDRYRVTSGKGFDLESFATDDLPSDIPGKAEAKTLLADGVKRLAKLQELLYANAGWSLLVVFQAMDAGGKDSTIEHVLSGVNPQGVAVTSFKAPGPHELAHDFLWRVHRVVPARGMIGVFNRSHYEDVLVTRVHPDLLDGSHLPKVLRQADGFWRDRIADIAAFEVYLARQGVRILKFFLNVGREEQKARLLARLDDPTKTWKFDPGDLRERAAWADYRKAYQAAIAGTASKTTPWYIVPADRKWYTRLIVAEAMIQALESLNLGLPTLAKDTQDHLDAFRHALERPET